MNVCLKCPEGYKSGTTIGMSYCLPCLPGEYQNEKGQELCQPCLSNTISTSASSISCDACGVGKSAANQGSAVCQDCQPGSAGTPCQKCTVGMYRGEDDAPSRCLTCEIGTTSTRGSAGCSPCALGKFHDQVKKQCLDCPVGSYQDFGGSTECKQCPVDTYSSTPGKASKADCTPCNSQRSTGESQGNTNASACLCRRTDFYQNNQTECVVCPPGGDCSASDGLTLNNIIALPGYWRANSTTDIFTDCAVAFSASLNATKDASERCIGGSMTRNSKESFNSDTQCKKGFGGPSCMACIDGYVMLDVECTKCEASIYNVIGAVSGILVIVYFIFVILFMRAKEDAEIDSHKEKKGCCGGKKRNKKKGKLKRKKTTAEQKSEDVSSFHIEFDYCIFIINFLFFLTKYFYFNCITYIIKRGFNILTESW